MDKEGMKWPEEKGKPGDAIPVLNLRSEFWPIESQGYIGGWNNCLKACKKVYEDSRQTLVPLDEEKVATVMFEDTNPFDMKWCDLSENVKGIYLDRSRAICAKFGTKDGGLVPLDKNVLSTALKDSANYALDGDFNAPNEWPEGVKDFYLELYGQMMDKCESMGTPIVPTLVPLDRGALQEVILPYSSKAFDIAYAICERFGTPALTVQEIFETLLSKRELNCKLVTEQEAKELNYYAKAIHQRLTK